MTTIAANAGASISSTSQLSIASVTCSADIQGRDVIATRELHCNGAAVFNSTVTVAGIGNVSTAINGKQATLTPTSALSAASVTTTALNTMSGGLRVSGGQGHDGTGASLRVTGTGDAVYNTSALLFGNSSVDLHQFELSWLAFAHFYRPNSSTAWAQTIGGQFDDRSLGLL